MPILRRCDSRQISGVATPYKLAAGPQKFTKAEIQVRLGQAFDYVIQVGPKLTPEQLDKTFRVDWKSRPEATGRQIALNMFVHVAHHRAHAEVYLRIKGIETPAYAF